MLGLVQSLFSPRVNPIGVDFGTSCLRMAQVQRVNGDFRLIAAASAHVPDEIAHDPGARLQFFAQAARDLLQGGGFQGRRAVLGLPSAQMQVAHLQVDAGNERELKALIARQAAEKLSIDASQAVIRHIVAGEIGEPGSSKSDVIVMAAPRAWIGKFLAAAEKGRLDVIGMNVEPAAMLDCFSHVYRRKSDLALTQCIIDIGGSGTRVTIVRGGAILLARKIDIGGDDFTEAAASGLGIRFEDARTLRAKIATAQPHQPAITEKPRLDEREDEDLFEPPTFRAGYPQRASSDAQRLEDGGLALFEPPVKTEAETEGQTAALTLARQGKEVERACDELVMRLASELKDCRAEHLATFPDCPIDRLIFTGGEARQKNLCKAVAQELDVPAQLGDPICRMGRISDVGIESGIDRRLPQPAWSVAIGLSMGSAWSGR